MGLDEPIKETIMRDLGAVASKFYHVPYPKEKKSLLKEWDLWGPLILCTLMATILQGHSTEDSVHYDDVNFDGDALHKEPLRLQLKVFMDEVQQQLMLPTIRSYLKLYTTMPLDKMAGFMEMPPEEFRNHLLAFKHKMKNVVWTKGTSGLEGEFQSGSEVDFYIDKNMIHIADTKVA